jgi:uncharacterized protein DUF3305
VNIAPLMRIPVGVVVERLKAASPWIDFVWQPAAVLPGQPDAAPWTVLSNDGDRTSFYAGACEIALHRSVSGHYRDNLASIAPSLWVVLRPTGGDPPYRLLTVTADPAEGEGFTQAGNDLVEAVPMPTSLRTAIEAFVAEHHVEQTTFKRERDRSDPQVLTRRAPRKDA